jgi:uncharacterized membrane protein YdjX (TVP38/TMEM64 family)
MIATALTMAGAVLSFISVVILATLILGAVFAGVAVCIGIVSSSIVRFAAYRFLVNTCRVITFTMEPKKSTRKMKKKIKEIAAS